MKKTIIAIALSLVSVSSFAASEQVWDAYANNSQQTCSVEGGNNQHSGGILAQGENDATTGGKGITFALKTNAPKLSYAITEAKIIEGKDAYDFVDASGDLTQISSTDKTSLFIGSVERSWADAGRDTQVAGRKASITLAPKINVPSQDFAYGQTHIQGKIKVTCSN